jgi:hypothetical protein
MLYGGVGRPVEWYYLLPFYIYQGEQDNRAHDDNAIWDADVKIVLAPVRIRAELMIDDIQIERKSRSDQEPQEIAMGCDLAVALADDPVFVTQCITYQMVTGWTFNQNKTWNRWLLDGMPLGAEYGNDFDRLAALTSVQGSCYRGELELSLLRKGQGNITDPWTAPWEHDSTWASRFPSGIVERRWTASLGGRRDFILRYRELDLLASVSLKCRYWSIGNAGHRAGVSEDQLDATAGLSLGCYF